ncbi:Bud site selection protein bud4 [Friedmanniomyces endolithicus]|uniref:Bud site selection protein bud4 n=1 Tax=Friedmanniomyces endolithicus TaxID=329885 RepID=A0AAN6KUE4_9PEZI|nr:Bud site selection protein bud4 [Friedmanniomyces endolithicus]KAK1003607.1 Bud site selection protein bud4 [Friedmanniomyces endolithicus]KAK1024827.1 Bud site selection protein bud4 [Friedmanniomyces endolithicus]
MDSVSLNFIRVWDTKCRALTAMVRQVQPLRISKSSNTPSSTPNKMATSRPLADIGNTSQRRNSPSFNQATKKMIVSRDSSPYNENSSPFVSATTSPLGLKRMSPFRFDENTPERSPSPSVSPKRRTSIERLKQASRVKNSNIFALENKDAYDPTSMPIVERPSANRPLSQQFANNSFTRFDSLNKENNPLQNTQRPGGHKRSDTEIYLPTLSMSREATEIALPPSPEKQQSPSPTKSAMRTSMFALSQQGLFDQDAGTWSDEERAPTPRTLHGNNKSVTFHADPPIVTEYEQQTPEPSVSVGSREGSRESDEQDQDDYSFERYSSAEQQEREDSFDEDLENTDKTPVVLPEDWRHMSPDEARTDLVNQDDDVFDASPSPHRSVLGRSESVTSDGEARPLPPLPAFMTAQKRSNHGGAAGPADHASLGSRNVPSPPAPASCSKDDILRMTHGSSLTLQERLQYLGKHPNNDRPSSSSDHEMEHAMPEELTVTNLDVGEKMDVQVRVAEAGVEDDDSLVGDLSEFASAPRISRESILRKIRNTKYDFEDDSDVDESVLDGEESKPQPSYAELARMDPDQPIQSRENSRETSENYLSGHVAAAPVEEYEEEVYIKSETTEDDHVDLEAIPEAVDAEPLLPPRPQLMMDDEERQSSVLHHRLSTESAEADDDASQYSSLEPEAESTMLHSVHQPGHEEGKESLQDAMQLLTVKDYSEMKATAPEPTAGATSLPRASFMGLPSYLGSGQYDFGMSAFSDPSPPTSSESSKKLDLASAPVLQSTRQFWQPAPADLPNQQAYSEPADLVSPPGTPDSIIQHRTSGVSSMYDELDGDGMPVQPELAPELAPEVVIPERRATIKTGGKLKTRPSVSRADLEAMGQQRMVSSEEPMPAIPSVYRTTDVNNGSAEDGDSQHSTEKADSLVEERPVNRRQSRKMLNLDIPQLSNGTGDSGLGLEDEFDKVIENQKVRPPFPPPPLTRFYAVNQQEHGAAHNHASVDTDMPSPFVPHTNGSAGANVCSPRPQKGYLMRQNTKVVVASNRNFSNDSNDTNKSVDSNATMPMSPRAARGTRSAGSSPRKPSAEQVLKTEPWNGKTRRKSMRQASAQQQARGPAPPLPGQESAMALSSVDEDYATATGNLDDEVPEGTERGRLFVKVVGVKDLDLPLPRNDRVYFQLTLDNGLHCVTTADLELGKTAPIGQEFELVVQEDLEFQLTLTTKLPPPPKPAATPTPSSPTKSVRSQKSGASGFAARFLSSPRKRAERERQEREAAELEDRRLQAEAAARKRASQAPPTAWELLHDLVNPADGAFARAYVNLKAHEGACYGRPLTVDVPCYNEWAAEKDAQVVNSVRSKRNHGGAGQMVVRRPPFVVGKLEVQLVYVPKPRGAGEEAMPKSMGSALREIGRAREEAGRVEEVREVAFEGCLSQQGGDCIHWRRRFFRLQGPRLTAYHEHTHQKRAVVNLAKASRLVDDKTSLVADPTTTTSSSSPAKSGGGRRKSAFAEEDEGYAYVEEGFRIRFANGETIDFYADSAEEKEGWMGALSQVIGKPGVGDAMGKQKKEEDGKGVRWTEVVLAREKAAAAASATAAGNAGAGAGAPAPSPYSGMMGAGTTAQNPSRAPPAPPSSSTSAQRRPQSDPRRAFPPPNSASNSKSAPNSPMKAPPPMPRARTPPMGNRSGGRTREAVKSMIF